MPLQRYRRYRISGNHVAGWKLPATLTTALAGANNDLIFQAVTRGLDGNDITIEYVVDGTDTPLTIDVTDTTIVVNVETDGDDAPVSTATEVKAAVEAEEDAAALVTASNAAGNSGAGVVTVMAETELAGGTTWVTGFSR